jgi:hypothetical protein
LEATNIPAEADWELTYTKYVDVYAKASQFLPKVITGLDADPHTLRNTKKGINTDRKFRIKPGKDLEPEAGTGSAKVQAFRHGYVFDDSVIEAYVQFDTVSLLQSPGKTEFVSGNVVDMNPKHHKYVSVTAGSKVAQQVKKAITVTDGVTISKSTTVSGTLSHEITDQVGL